MPSYTHLVELDCFAGATKAELSNNIIDGGSGDPEDEYPIAHVVESLHTVELVGLVGRWHITAKNDAGAKMGERIVELPEADATIRLDLPVAVLSFTGPDPGSAVPPESIVRGDDYQGDRATRIDITSGADLTGLYLVLAANDGDGAEFSYRMAIQGAAGAHYAEFDAAGSITCQWPARTYAGVLRIEHEAGPPAAEQLIWRGETKVTDFPTPAADE